VRLRSLAIAALALLALPSGASAHAVLEETSPERGAIVESAPAEVALRFNEPIEASFGAIRVFDAAGEQVETGELTRPEGSSEAIAVALPEDLPDGTYTATYRVVSADSHPISGGFVFTVGDPGAGGAASVGELLADADSGPVTDVAFWLARGLAYLATGLAVGMLAFRGFVWRPALRRIGTPAGAEWQPARGAFAARWRRAMAWTVVTGLLASAAMLVLQGATAAGTSGFEALDPQIVGEVLGTRFGESVAARICAWLLLAGSLLLSRDGAGARQLGWALAAVAAAALVVSPALAGHAATHDPSALLVAADALHVAAMCAWLGGLVALGVLMPAATRPLAPAEKTRLLAATLARFSPVALGAVAALLATGALAAVVYLTAFDELWGTAFGRAVGLKIVLIAALVALGALNRHRLVPALRALADRGEAPGRPGDAVRASLRGEIALVVGVLGVTAALVTYPPPTDLERGPASGTVTAGPAIVDYTVDPARSGPNEIHLYLFDAEDGSQFDARRVELELELPEREIGPIEAELERAGPGHFVAYDAPLGVPGDWEGRVSFRLSRFEEARATFEVDVR
jgi:copper transport protein